MKKQFNNPRDLKKEMMNAAVSVMEAFQSDLVEDFERVDELAASETDGWFYWAVRKGGTHTRETLLAFDELVKDYDDTFVIKALVGRSVEDGTYEISYSKHPNKSEYDNETDN